MSYYPTGKIEQELNYSGDLLSGSGYYYLPDGRLKAVNKYWSDELYYKEIYVFDSSGTNNSTYTGIFPVVGADASQGGDTAIVQFNLPINHPEYNISNFILDASIAAFNDGVTVALNLIEKMHFQDQYLSKAVSIVGVDSIYIQGRLTYQNGKDIVQFDQFNRSVVFKYTEAQ
jgi:hypothetical protein